VIRRVRLATELKEHAREHPERGPVVARMLALLEQPGEVFARGHLDPGHFTASAFVLCPEASRLLLIRHPKLGRWLQPGGHIEAGDLGCLEAARREAEEETGATGLELLGPGIFDVDVHAIPGTPGEGEHAHFDVRYAFHARSALLRVGSEVKDARWVELGEVPALNDEESILRPLRELRAWI
jgi:8-oxo-dGTP pyrophosphatase MutT (NUDIX family)